MSERINRALSDFLNDRPTMKENNTLETLKVLLQGEVFEVEEARTHQELEEELADVIIYAWTMMLKLNIDPEDAIMTKVAANHLQHEARHYQHGDFETNRVKAKEAARIYQVKETVYED